MSLRNLKGYLTPLTLNLMVHLFIFLGTVSCTLTQTFYKFAIK